MDKPLVIQLKELENTITASVKAANRAGIPCFLVEPIIAKIHAQVSDAARTEYERAQKQLADEEAKKQAEQKKERG